MLFRPLLPGTIADLPYEYVLEPRAHVKRVSPLVPKCDAFVVSGCRDAQCSQDLGSRVGGALTSTVLPLLSGWRKVHPEVGNPSVEAFLDRLRKLVNDKIHSKTQTPCVSSSREMFDSTQLPLDQPRQRYIGEQRGGDDFEIEESPTNNTILSPTHPSERLTRTIDGRMTMTSHCSPLRTRRLTLWSYLVGMRRTSRSHAHESPCAQNPKRRSSDLFYC